MNMLNLGLTFATLLLAILSLVLGIFSLYRNPTAPVVRMWFFFSLAVGLWSGTYFLLQRSESESQALLVSSLLHVGASFIPVLFYHFVLLFSFRSQQQRIFLILGYVFGILFALLSLTPLIISGVSPKIGFRFWLDAGPLYPGLLVYFWLYALASILTLYDWYRHSDGVIRQKALYILIAAVIGFVGGGTSFLPQTVGIYPWGQFLTWLYAPLITYGIFIKEH